MKAFVLCLVVLIASLGFVQAEPINPSTDVLTKNVDGEIVTIFGPDGFFFDSVGFHNPVAYINGTAHIGGK